MNNFSIAPWKLTHAWSNAGYIRTIKDAQGEHIAYVCDLEDALAECTANARLMAAAPELLAVVQDLLDYAESATLENDDEPELFKQARAAIAAATGDQTLTA